MTVPVACLGVGDRHAEARPRRPLALAPAASPVVEARVAFVTAR